MTQLMLMDLPRDISRMPVEPIVRDAQIEGEYRYVLKRAWGAGPCIMWCGLNPSKADATIDDPTIKREIGFSYRWGFGSLIKVNIYPFITSQPSVLRLWLTELGRQHRIQLAWNKNIDVIRDYAAVTAKRIAVWGNSVSPGDIDEVGDWLYENDGSDFAWHCLGINADGSPRHTLARGKHRIPDDAKPILWRKPLDREAEA